MKKVLVAVDGSEASAQALRKAAELAKSGGAELFLLHVGAISALDLANPHVPMGGDDVLPSQIEQRLQKRGEDILQVAQQQISDLNLKVKTQMLLGHPGDAICEIADEEQPDFVVVGSRGQNKLQRMVLGSVSDYVVRHCGSPVIVVKKD